MDFGQSRGVPASLIKGKNAQLRGYIDTPSDRLIELGKPLPYHLAMPANGVDSITRPRPYARIMPCE